MSTERSITLSEGLLIEILARLPVKSLLKMKLVSKAWYTLINSTHFVHMHANLAIQDQLIISDSHVLSFRSNDNRSFTTRGCKPDLVLPSYGGLDCSIVGSCNGIVCFSDYSSIIYLCNPATREFKRLPPTSFLPRGDVKIYNDFKPAFGFDSSNMYDLKVISLHSAFCKGVRGSVITAEVFSLSSNSWRQLDWIGEHMNISMTSEAKFCANSCHWSLTYHNNDSILCFDMHTQSFKTMNFPKIKFDDIMKNSCSLMVFKECLSVLSFSPFWNNQEYYIDIWIMKEYGVEDSWTKLCRSRPHSNFLYPLTFWMDDRALLLRDDGEKVVSCNFNNVDVDFVEFNCGTKYLSAIFLKETLVSIK